MKVLATGAPACVTVTLLDGLVLARSEFHHSMNYRSVVVLGRASEIVDPGEKRRALPGEMRTLGEALQDSSEEIREASVWSRPNVRTSEGVANASR